MGIEPLSFHSIRSLHSLIRFHSLAFSATVLRRTSGCENRTGTRRSASLRSAAATGGVRFRSTDFRLVASASRQKVRVRESNPRLSLHKAEG